MLPNCPNKCFTTVNSMTVLYEHILFIRWINHSTPGTIRPPELCYFKHEYEAGVGRRFSCYNRICHDVGGRACGGVSVLVRDGTTHSQITLNTTLHCGLRQLIWCC